MWKISFCLFCLCLACSVQAKKDPFDKSQRSSSTSQKLRESTTEPITKKPIISCQMATEHLAKNTPFEQLKLVGIIQYKDHSEALFWDQERMVSLQSNQWIAAESYQIKEIRAQEILLLKPTDVDCQHFTEISVQL